MHLIDIMPLVDRSTRLVEIFHHFTVGFATCNYKFFIIIFLWHFFLAWGEIVKETFMQGKESIFIGLAKFCSSLNI